MAMGTVKVYSPGRGSGWIRPDSGGNLVYVHKSGVVREDESVAARLEKGQRVEFQIGQRPKGTAAINVRVVEGDGVPATAATGAEVEDGAEAGAEAEAEA